jgi:LPS-assembly protein
VPRLLASGDWNFGRAGLLSYGFDSELVNFERNVGVTGWRLRCRADRRPRLLGRGFLSAAVGGVPLHAVRARRTTAPGTDASPQSRLPFAALDAGMTFEREADRARQRRMTLEPRLLYLYTPYRNQDDLPVFDTALPDLNIVQLFSTNRYVGADRVGNANQASVGFTARLFDAKSGASFLAATIGQTFYFERRASRCRASRRAAIDGSRTSSPQLALTAYGLELRFRLAVESAGLPISERSQVRVQYRPDAERVLNFGYRLQRERLEQAERLRRLADRLEALEPVRPDGL